MPEQVGNFETPVTRPGQIHCRSASQRCGLFRAVGFLEPEVVQDWIQSFNSNHATGPAMDQTDCRNMHCPNLAADLADKGLMIITLSAQVQVGVFHLQSVTDPVSVPVRSVLSLLWSRLSVYA